ncbi:MAG: EamA family transporter [Planctomycetota bacterium]|nr:EamA family transporter [Planctomycetota bacterium]
MDTLPFLLAAVSAVLHAFWNATLKTSRDAGACIMAAGTLQGLVFLPCFVWLAPWGALEAALPFALLSALIHIAYRLLLSRALQTGALSQAYAVARSAPLLVALGGVYLFGETIGPAAWAAMGAAVLGVGVLHARELRALLGRRGEPGAWSGPCWAFLTMLSVAAYTLSDDAGVQRMEPAPYMFLFTALSSGLYLAPLPLTLRGRDRLNGILEAWRGERKHVLTVAFFEPLSYALILSAFTLAPAGTVSAVRLLSVPVAAAIGIWRFKEPAGGLRLAGAALVAAGAAALKLAN